MQDRIPSVGGRGEKSKKFLLAKGAPEVEQNWVSGYEGVYPWRTTRNTIESMFDGEWTQPPFTFVLPDKSAYASITEGALVNYSGMMFQSDAAHVLHARLAHAAPMIFAFGSRHPQDIEASPVRRWSTAPSPRPGGS